MPKKNKDPELEERRARRQSIRETTPVSRDEITGGGSGPVDDGKLDRQSAYDKSMQTGEVINPSHFRSRLEWQEYYDALPQEFKANYRAGVKGREDRRNNYLSFGGNFGDLGIENKKEEGQAAYRRMGMHNLDKSYSYDWEKGIKYNIATSDDNVYMKPVPITADDWAEKAEIDKYGANPEGYARRLQDSTRNTLNKWSAQNIAADPSGMGGKIHRGADGKLQAIGENGQTIYFDDFGNALDGAGNPTGVNYATGGWGSLAGAGVLPKTNPEPTANSDPAGGNFARQVIRQRADYGGWGQTYGPGTSGSGITIPQGSTPPVAMPISAPTVSAGWGSAPQLSAPTQPSAPARLNNTTRPPTMKSMMSQPTVNPFQAPGSPQGGAFNRPKNRPVGMGFGAY